MIPTRDLYADNYHRFKSATAAALNNKISTLVHQRNEIIDDPVIKLQHTLNRLGVKSALHPNTAVYTRVVDKVHFFGLTVDETQKELAIECLIDILNDLGESGSITGCLAPLVEVELFSVPFEKKQYAIVSYVAIHYKHAAAVLSKFDDFLFEEAGVARDFSTILKKFGEDKTSQVLEQELAK